MNLLFYEYCGALAVPRAKSYAKSSTRCRLRTGAGSEVVTLRPGSACWRRASLNETVMAVAGNHQDAGSPSLGMVNLGCGCCCGQRHNLSWVNVVPSLINSIWAMSHHQVFCKCSSPWVWNGSHCTYGPLLINKSVKISNLNCLWLEGSMQE